MAEKIFWTSAILQLQALVLDQLIQSPRSHYVNVYVSPQNRHLDKSAFRSYKVTDLSQPV